MWNADYSWKLADKKLNEGHDFDFIIAILDSLNYSFQEDDAFCKCFVQKRVIKTNTPYSAKFIVNYPANVQSKSFEYIPSSALAQAKLHLQPKYVILSHAQIDQLITLLNNDSVMASDMLLLRCFDRIFWLRSASLGESLEQCILGPIKTAE